MNFLIRYAEDSKNENISEYYKKMMHLSELIDQEIDSKRRQQKVRSFFKSVNLSSNASVNEPEVLYV